MSSLGIAFISAACIFGGSILGMRLQRLLPSHHLSKEMQELVKLSAGTIATLTALVLGLLLSSAMSSFDAINTGIGRAVPSSSSWIERWLAAGWMLSPCGINDTHAGSGFRNRLAE
jgi:hypothetical protein